MDSSVIGCIDVYGVKDFTDHHGEFTKRDGGGYKLYMKHIVYGKDLREFKEEADQINPFVILDKDDDNHIRKPLPPLFIIRNNIYLLLYLFID